MKTILLISFLLIIFMGVQAQDLIVHKNDGSEISIPINTIDSITFGTNLQVTGTFSDERDGNEYSWIQIGEQVWMAENLAFLPGVDPPSIDSETEAHYYVYDYDGTDVAEAKETYNYQTYGVLYNWPAALLAVPDGWHLPTDEEYKELEIFLGMTPADADKTSWRQSGLVGIKLKSASGWDFEGNGDNSSGFNALPSGERSSTHQFTQIGSKTSFWTSTEYNESRAWRRLLEGEYDWVFRQDYIKEFGYAVRCIKD